MSSLSQADAKPLDQPLWLIPHWMSCCIHGDKSLILRYTVKNFHTISTYKCKVISKVQLTVHKHSPCLVINWHLTEWNPHFNSVCMCSLQLHWSLSISYWDFRRRYWWHSSGLDRWKKARTYLGAEWLFWEQKSSVCLGSSPSFPVPRCLHPGPRMMWHQINSAKGRIFFFLACGQHSVCTWVFEWALGPSLATAKIHLLDWALHLGQGRLLWPEILCTGCN